METMFMVSVYMQLMLFFAQDNHYKKKIPEEKI